jgi:RimJ/RimL family protein N-acetyltransferase
MRAEKLTLRAVRNEDCRLLWDWVNAADVRRASFQSAAVSWEEHVAWFSSKRGDPDCVHYLALLDNGAPIGQIRFDIAGGEAVVGVSVGAAHRGKGHGAEIIESGVRELFASPRNIGIVHAYIKKDNDASLNAFMKAGFSSRGEESDRNGVRCVHLCRRRDS